MTVEGFLLLLTVLFIIGLSLRIYQTVKGKEWKFIKSWWYQGAMILFAIFLYWQWNKLVMNGTVHDFSQRVAEVIVSVVQMCARALHLR